jgi:hypothetical protein
VNFSEADIQLIKLTRDCGEWRETHDNPSPDQLVCPRQQRLRHGDFERFRGLEVDYQFEVSRMLNWKIAWAGAS